MKKIKIFSIIIIIFLVIGLFKVNLNLNRQIYMGIVSDIKGEYAVLNKDKASWNLDHMVDVLSYPDKYNIGNINEKENFKEEDMTIPKVRILFSGRPFDFRIDTKNYTFVINGGLLSNFKASISNIMDKVKGLIG